ncbi:hypothetical protein Tco_1115383 [Tanacetum coccineum]
MLAPGNYVQWKSRLKRYIDIKLNKKFLHYCLTNPPYEYKWIPTTTTVAEDGMETTTQGHMEAYHNVLKEIREQLDAEAETVEIILTGIDNDIYSTIDACPNACEMWKAIEMLKHGESINVQDLETNLYWEFGKLTSQDGESLESYYSRFYKMMNELVRNKCEISNHQVNVQFLLQLQPEWQRIPHPDHNQLLPEIEEKQIAYSPPPTYDQAPVMDAKDDEMSKEKEIDKLMALISLSFKKIYKPTTNNLRTSSNTTRECQNSKRQRYSAYHKEKMLLCKQEEAGIQLSAEQVDWRDDADDEQENQELEAHYMYMAKIQEVSPDDAESSGPIFDFEPLPKVQYDDGHYNVFSNDRTHPEQPESVNDTYSEEQCDNHVIIDSTDMGTHRDMADQDDDDDDLSNERDFLASLIDKLKCEIDDSKTHNKLLVSSNKILVDNYA